MAYIIKRLNNDARNALARVLFVETFGNQEAAYTPHAQDALKWRELSECCAIMARLALADDTGRFTVVEV